MNEKKRSTIDPGIRYVLHPGYVTSANDGDEHFIGARELAALYGVDIRGLNVIVLSSERDRRWYRERQGDVHLHPRYDGNYSLPSVANRRLG